MYYVRWNTWALPAYRVHQLYGNEPRVSTAVLLSSGQECNLQYLQLLVSVSSDLYPYLQTSVNHDHRSVRHVH